MSEHDFDLAIIGGGPGGYVAAIRGAQLGMKVALIEKRPKLGGTCLNVGCIPSKYLLHVSELIESAKHEGSLLGISVDLSKINLKKIIQEKSKLIDGLSGGIAALMGKNKITRFEASASFASPQSLQLSSGETLKAKHFIIATGSQSIELPFMPFDKTHILSSDEILELETVPKSLLIIGAGVIGLEMGCVLARMGCEVKIIEALDSACPFFDPNISKTLTQSLTEQGLEFHFNMKVQQASVSGKKVSLLAQDADGKEKSFEAEKVLVAVGRKPFTQGLDLEKANVQLDDRKRIKVNSCFQTTQSNIFAIGDVIDGAMLAHKASEEGVVVVEYLNKQKTCLNYQAIPNVVYTSPEVACVGLTLKEAKEAGLEVLVGKFPFKANSRAKASLADQGFVQLIFEAKTEHLIGMHMIGPQASELIAQGALAVNNQLTLKEIIHTPYAHPTLSEAIKEAALQAKRMALHI